MIHWEKLFYDWNRIIYNSTCDRMIMCVIDTCWVIESLQIGFSAVIGWNESSYSIGYFTFILLLFGGISHIYKIKRSNEIENLIIRVAQVFYSVFNSPGRIVYEPNSLTNPRAESFFSQPIRFRLILKNVWKCRTLKVDE